MQVMAEAYLAPRSADLRRVLFLLDDYLAEGTDILCCWSGENKAAQLRVSRDHILQQGRPHAAGSNRSGPDGLSIHSTWQTELISEGHARVAQSSYRDLRPTKVSEGVNHRGKASNNQVKKGIVVGNPAGLVDWYCIKSCSPAVPFPSGPENSAKLAVKKKGKRKKKGTGETDHVTTR